MPHGVINLWHANVTSVIQPSSHVYHFRVCSHQHYVFSVAIAFRSPNEVGISDSPTYSLYSLYISIYF